MCLEDRPTLENVLAQHGTFLRTTLRQLGVPAADVDDVQQEVLLAVHRGLGRFDPQLAPIRSKELRGWLFGICRRQAASYRRAQALRPESATESAVVERISDGTPPPEEHLAGAEGMACLMRLVGNLLPERQAVFVAHEIEGTPIAEVAVALAIPENTAWNRLRLARGDLAAAVRRVGLAPDAPLPKKCPRITFPSSPVR